MGRKLLDALRRIDAEKASWVHRESPAPAAPDPPPVAAASAVPEVHAADRPSSQADSASSQPGRTVAVMPDRSGLFQPTAPRASFDRSAAEATTPAVARDCVGAAPGPFPPASRWWKKPPQPTSLDRESGSRKDQGESHAEHSLPPRARAGSESPRDSRDLLAPTAIPRAEDDLAAHLLETHPPGRNALVLLCDPDADDVAPAVASLAVALAARESGRLLAADATPHGGGLTRWLSVEDTARQPVGWIDILAGKIPWREAACATGVPNLEFVHAMSGPTALAPTSDASADGGWTPVLRHWREEYRFVVIGVVSGENSVTATLVREADAIYLVLRPGQTGQHATRRAVQAFRRRGGRVSGCILLSPSE